MRDVSREKKTVPVSNQCPVRCFCGNEIQTAYSNYCRKLKSGQVASLAEALNSCGLPMSSPFAPPLGTANSYVSPPSLCCRAMLMCNSDLSTQHNIYQSIVRWAEGDAALGDKSQNHPQNHPQSNPQNTANKSTPESLKEQQRRVTFAPAVGTE